MNQTQEIDVALSKLTYGFHIVTTRKPAEEMETRDKDYLAAGTVSWIMQTSIEPPLITVALNKESDLAETVAKSGVFNIHTLGTEEENLIEQFSGDSDISAQQINDLGFQLSPATKSPMLNIGISVVECEVVEEVVTNGDHMLFIGKITGTTIRKTEAAALHRWQTSFEYGGVS